MMSPLKWIFSVCLFICSLKISASEGPENITVKPGENATLICKLMRNIGNFAVEWTRPDLKDEYVILCRDGKCDPENQHLPFRGQVELTDPLIKDGDASLTLKNVTIKDTGIYECYIRIKGNSRKPICTIPLTVTESGGGAGRTVNGGDKLSNGMVASLLSLLLLSRLL
ncbi:hypothetical protein Q5P01_002995 [Channa striata]|uniref:Ig-like domain-containing protein n=1 Tax=Channa striata TaxID=64152 RepID=A0AA88T599_CHASR|nr:hypothetical protein Q5P01_002995 [Channa striata]